MPPEETTTDNTQATANEAPEAPPAWFQTWLKANDERIDKRFAGLAEKTSRLQSKEEPPKESKSITAEDLAIAMRVGEIKASLPKAAKERLEAFASSNGFAASLQFAEALVAMSPAETQSPTIAPRGVGASPSPKATQTITTKAQYLEWRKTASAAERDAFLREVNINDLPGH